tara:strand:+ start:8437 stop:9063 length:627 start_codon:yes stop_codon:yes gene_type:complete
MYHTQKFKQVTLLNLIDFEGNELLSDNKDLDQLRFSTLKRLLFEHPCEDLCILSENLDEKPHATRTLELYEEVKDRYDWQWLEWDNKYRNGDPNSIKEIKKKYKGKEIKNVIVVGQNLPGCVFKTLDHSALRWAQQGHYTQIVLSMCGDYEVSGVGPLKYMKSFANLYKQIKKAGQWSNIDLVCDIDDIMYYNDGIPYVLSDREPPRK